LPKEVWQCHTEKVRDFAAATPPHPPHRVLTRMECERRGHNDGPSRPIQQANSLGLLAKSKRLIEKPNSRCGCVRLPVESIKTGVAGVAGWHPRNPCAFLSYRCGTRCGRCGTSVGLRMIIPMSLIAGLITANNFQARSESLSGSCDQTIQVSDFPPFQPHEKSTNAVHDRSRGDRSARRSW
jgi:hypothetical protein